MAEIAGEPFNEREEQSLVSHIRELFGRWKSELTVFKTRAESGQNHGRKEIEEGLVLLNGILNEKEEYAVIEKITAAADDLKDFSEDWGRFGQLLQKPIRHMAALEYGVEWKF